MNKYEIASTATEIGKNFSRFQIAWFHYFSPAGLCAAKRVRDEAISKLVDEGKTPSGAILAHGSLSTFCADRMQKLAMKRQFTRIDLHVAVEMLEEEIERQDRFLAKFA